MSGVPGGLSNWLVHLCCQRALLGEFILGRFTDSSFNHDQSLNGSAHLGQVATAHESHKAIFAQR